MTAKRGPIPRQGILDIAPYVPGTSALPGAHSVIKLSSNESPFGPSPRAVEAFIEAASSLSRYPDGSARRSASFTASIPTVSSAAQAPTRC
jgi:histidinol-phosphate aminotransferase